MELLIIIILAIAGFTFYQKLQQGGSNKQKNSSFKYEPDSEVWPFEQADLLTATEKKFFRTLKNALPSHQIFVQIPLSEMLRVQKGHDYKAWSNRINRMRVDFVVCDDECKIIAAIELDDKSHDNDKRRADDAKKDKALNSARIRIIRWRVENMPSVEAIQGTVLGGTT